MIKFKKKNKKTVTRSNEAIDQYLYMNYPFENIDHVLDVIESGKVYINGSAILDPKYVMKDKDNVDFEISRLKTTTVDLLVPEARKISKSRIVFENEDVIIVNKNFHDTMENNPKKYDLNSLVKEYLRAKHLSTKSNIYLYRLHDEIKGLVVYSKTQKGYQMFDSAIRRKEIKCTFLAASINAPFYNEKKIFNLAPPFIRTDQNRLEKVTQESKNTVLRVNVKNIGKVKFKKMTYGLLEIKTVQIRRPNIRFLLSYYGMTIINDKSAMGNRYSNDIVLYLQKIEFPPELEKELGLKEIALSRDATISKMNKILESNARKQYA